MLSFCLKFDELASIIPTSLDKWYFTGTLSDPDSKVHVANMGPQEPCYQVE